MIDLAKMHIWEQLDDESLLRNESTYKYQEEVVLGTTSLYLKPQNIYKQYYDKINNNYDMRVLQYK